MARKKEITQLDFWLSAAKNAELQLKFFNAQKKYINEIIERMKSNPPPNNFPSKKIK